MSQVGPLEPGDPRAIGSYRLLGRVGAGGQGTVFLGETGEGRRVAVKVINWRLSKGSRTRERFLREVTAARSVAPFCTAQVLDVDIAGEEPYIVSEYIEGVPLSTLVARHGPMAARPLERLAVGTAAALAAIHNARVVHRDFKPSNVLLGQDGPRVIDFGIARALDMAATQSTEAVGTPAYMSPEQISGLPVGAPSDVFSWAVTMVYAATGAPAFGSDTIAAVFGRVLYAEPDLSGVPESLARLLATCLRKNPAERPTAAELMLALVGHDVPERVASAPPGTPPAGVPRVTEGPADLTTLDPPPRRTRRRWALPLAAASIVAVAAVAAAVILIPRTAGNGERKAGPAFGKPVGTPLTGHTAEVLTLGCATARGRPVIVSGSFDTRLLRWDLATRGPLGSPMSGHTNAVAALTTATVGGTGVAVSGSDDQTERVWDLASGRPLRTMSMADGIWALAPATLGGRTVIVAGGKSGRIHVRDPADGSVVGSGISTGTDPVGALAVTTVNGRPAVAAPVQGAIRLWDLATGMPVGKPLTGHTGMVMALAAGTLNGNPILVSGGQDKTVRVWDVTSGTEIGAPFSGHTGPVGALAVTTLKDGRPVAVSGSDDGTLRVWDLAGGAEIGGPFRGHQGPVRAVATGVLPTGPVAISAGNDRTVRVWGLGPPFPPG